MFSQVYLVCCIFLAKTLAQDSILPIVNTISGQVIGSQSQNGLYYEYQGIPYADSTSGSNRFKAPTPPPRFAEPFIANRTGIKCVRPLGTGFEGTEDCLVLNVFTPMTNTTNLSVMVWVKGKEFDGVYEHELFVGNIVAKDVVVVTMNYRESILGFLCLGTETAPGNAGLKDIVAGLRWIRENIEQFGGNPDDVTLFGHGSGAAAVDLVTLSPMGNGLVHKAISQSGNAFAPWAVSRDNLQYTIQVAEALGHTITDVESLSSVFARASISALMAVINDLELTDNALAFTPCLENGALVEVVPFMTKSPYEIISDGEQLNIPFMLGFVNNEGTIRSEEVIDSDWLEQMNSRFSDFLQSDLQFDSDEAKETIAESVEMRYFNNEPIDYSNIDRYIDYHGDTMILVSAIREARIRASASASPTYLYQFSYKGSLGETFVGPIVVNGAAHGEELGYLFPDPAMITAESTIPERDLTIADILIERWTNFAKNSVPSSETSLVEWSPFTNNNQRFLHILNSDETSSTLEVELVNPHAETMSFWDSIYEEHFLDAESSWNLSERDQGETTGPGDVDGVTDDPGAVDMSTESSIGEIGTTEPTPDSASTAVGYTFVILALFAVLNQFHACIIIS